MGPGDVPEPEKSKPADIEYVKAAKESHNEFMGELMKLAQDGKGSGDSKSDTRIENHGQIDSISFPPGWVAGKPHENPGIGARSYREVHRKDNPDTAVSFFYRGLPINDQSALSFKEALSKGPHELTEDEKKAVKDVLSTKTPVGSDQFNCSSARVEDLNGKKVLVVEGAYNNGDKIHSVYVDADGSGRFVQEIYYQSPKGQYEKHLKDALKAFKSIDWK